MKKPKVEFVEIVDDDELASKEREATGVVERFYPGCGPVKLYRTSEGHIGLQMRISLIPGDRKRWEEMYRAVMKTLGHTRGRPTGERTVQTKLHLPLPVYSALKNAASASGDTMSKIVADSLRARL